MADILFLAHRCPYPPDRGDRIRSWNILRYLSARARVHLIAFSETSDVSAPLRDCCASVTLVPHRPRLAGAMVRGWRTGLPASAAYFDNAALSRAVQECLARTPISTVYAFSGQMAQHVPVLPDRVRFIMDFVDVDSAKFEDFARLKPSWTAWVYQREAARLAAFEGQVARRADQCLFVSKAEATLVAKRSGGDTRISVLPNGVDAQFYAPLPTPDQADGEGPLLVFTGQMDYAPNVDAAAWMADHILPRIHAVYPKARFAIVGRNRTRRVRALARKSGVEVTGAVQDPRIWIARAALVVAPMRIGRGVQNKVLEAMAMGRPVVATPLAAEGINIRAETEFVSAAGVDPFARALLDLLAHPQKAAQIGARARQAMLDRYSWDRCLAPLDTLLTGTRPA